MIKIHINRKAKVKHICDFHFNASFQFTSMPLQGENACNAYLITCVELKGICNVLGHGQAEQHLHICPDPSPAFEMKDFHPSDSQEEKKPQVYKAEQVVFYSPDLIEGDVIQLSCGQKASPADPSWFWARPTQQVDYTPLAAKYHDLQVCKC